MGEAAGVMVVGEAAGLTAVGEAAGLMGVNEAVGVTISGVADGEVGRDCETVSGPAGGDVSGRV